MLYALVSRTPHSAGFPPASLASSLSFVGSFLSLLPFNIGLSHGISALYSHSLGDLFQPHGFKYGICANKFQIFIWNSLLRTLTLPLRYFVGISYWTCLNQIPYFLCLFRGLPHFILVNSSFLYLSSFSGQNLELSLPLFLSHTSDPPGNLASPFFRVYPDSEQFSSTLLV